MVAGVGMERSIQMPEVWEAALTSLGSLLNGTQERGESGFLVDKWLVPKPLTKTGNIGGGTGLVSWE